ncbi:4736_t:CDS:2 [Ambispora gerdemannii]|uniref:4736_t:CDS:1 n=1 Tax=Ambispora gerdemannii TaxID=144530 RepID=A0A9N8YMR6_9GLOM|nr:4736_t:CDS:2 [Ambispora gerdemannii]
MWTRKINTSTSFLRPILLTSQSTKAAHFRHFCNSVSRNSQVYYIAKSTSKGETYRLHLEKSRHLVGIGSTRGTREYNEDRYRSVVLDFGEDEAERKVNNQSFVENDSKERTNISENEFQLEEGKAGQICYFAIFDGHGGSLCADYLTENLHKQIEEVEASDADGIVSSWRKVGGYFRRFKPKTLIPLLSPELLNNPPRYRSSENTDNNNSNLSVTRNFSSTSVSGTQHLPTTPSISSIPSTISGSSSLTLEQRLTLAFLKIDYELIGSIGQAVGSTASVAIVKSLDRFPFWSTKELDITVAHVGDTRVLLCEVPTGKAVSLSYDHHPNATTEHDRLRKSGGYVITDSFGAERFLGSLANTRALGDSKLKKFGITAEPDIMNKRIKGNDAAFLVLVSDGVTSVLSNQEIVDCVKIHTDPTLSATKLVALAEELGSEDNITAMVIRLPGWGSEMPDHTKELRKYRLENTSIRRRT